MMQDDSFPAAERILADIDSVFKKDPKLEEFDIVPVSENQNKSPVIHVNHSLGLESWCVRHMYCYIYHRLMNLRVRGKREDPAVLIRLLHGALLINPDTSTFWNMSKELVQKERLSPEAEMHFTAVVLTRKAKCSEALNQRKWLLNYMMIKNGVTKSSAEVEEVLSRELCVSEAAAARYPNNYHAWNHRMWVLSLLSSRCQNESAFLASEWQSSGAWVASHVSDHSGMQYRQFLLQKIFTLNAEQLVQSAEDWKECIEYFINGNDFGPLSSNCWNQSTCIGRQMGLICSELRTNCDLIFRFEGHEALWCHRRFLLSLAKRLAIERIVNRIDFDCSCSRLTKVMTPLLSRLEQSLVRSCLSKRTDNPHQARHAQQHLKWMNCVLKIELLEEG